MRVGRRLKNSNLAFNACYPILLPRKHINSAYYRAWNEYTRNFLAGLQATMAFVRQRFWLLSLRSIVHGIIQKCITCFGGKLNQSEALIGSLTANRVNVFRPFSRCGVDYAGSLLLREGKCRNARSHKAYVPLFMCFATKAIHLQLMSDLTSEAFIAAFKGFISRRGTRAHVFG